MLKAVKGQLSLLAIEQGDVFAREVRKRYGSSNAQWAVSKSLNLILIMPDLIGRIRDLSDDTSLTPDLRRLNQYVLIYLYHPYDFIPEETSALFGYLDDAYLVGAVYSRLRRFASTAPRQATAEDLTRDLEASLEVVRLIVPKETRRIDQLIEELTRGKRDFFEKLMKRDTAGPGKRGGSSRAARASKVRVSGR
jgi:uncharacterized membrane protein YkvA (DUF1232 family)